MSTTLPYLSKRGKRSSAEVLKVMLRTRREKVSLMSGGPERPKCDIAAAEGGGGARVRVSAGNKRPGGGGGGYFTPFKRRNLSTVYPTSPTPTETLFRLLCPTPLSGGLIGVRGSVVQNIRASTGARIRVDDPAPAAADSVVHVVADAAAWDGDASPAQRALALLFHQLARLEGDGRDACCCRLLAPAGQPRSVFGPGGRLLERIEHDTGAHVRVLSSGNPQFPPGIDANDDVIQIYGNFSSVRKALLSISSYLQDNPRTPTQISTSPFGTNFRGVAPPAYGDPNVRRSFLPSPNGPDYHPRAYSSNPGMNSLTSGVQDFPEEEVMFRILCSNQKVGCITGKAGAVIHALQSETGASVMVADSFSDSDEKVIVISSRERAGQKHSPAQEAILRVYSRLVEVGHVRGSLVSARLLVPVHQIGCLLGRGGTIIAEMRRATGANIDIFPQEQVPKSAQPHDELVEVTGTVQSVGDALLHITGRIRESIFRLKPYASGGMNSYMSAGSDVPLHGSRIDSTPPGRYSTTGHSHALHSSGGLYDPSERQTPFTHGVDSIDTHPSHFSYGSENSGLRPPFDHSSSPRLWGHQGLNSGNRKGIPDAGTSLNFRSAIMGSGNQTPDVTSISIRVVVPEHLLGFVYGEDGNNLYEIREISGAQVSIFDPKAGATEGEVMISGSPDQTGMAQSLLHAFIFCGQESS